MIKGMTGFGSSQAALGSLKGVIEIKSLNHRYLDIGYYLPTGFASAEGKIRDLIGEHIERGRVTVSIRIADKPTQTIVFNKEAIKTYLKYAKLLKKEFKLNGSLSIVDLIQLPGVLDTRETTLNPETFWPIIEKGLTKALDSVIHMRRREGKSLTADISAQLNRMALQVNTIKSRVKTILAQKKKNLNAEEFASFQKSSDVNEELSRLMHHIDELRLLLKAEAAAGKKIDFIAQEMQRETNTIGAKLPDQIVSHAVIALKSKIEKIREQSQNIE